ncbi:MAG: hypothetical protein SF052_27710 [Bacteroidia bacterium]|nr:hypothetical protein [Bacteroidia bacterium]
MSKKATFHSSKVHLTDARILSFSIGGENEFYITPEELVGVVFRVKSEEFFDTAQKLARVILNIQTDIQFEDDESNELKSVTSIGKFRLGFSFLVDNFEELIQISEKEETIPSVDGTLITHILAIAYATARGMILVKTMGTYLEGAILPIIDPSELLNKPRQPQV